MKLKSAKHLDNHSQIMVENAFYTVIPPAQVARKQKAPLPPLHAFIKHLLMEKVSLKKGMVDVIVKKLRKLPWTVDPQVD